MYQVYFRESRMPAGDQCIVDQEGLVCWWDDSAGWQPDEDQSRFHIIEQPRDPMWLATLAFIVIVAIVCSVVVTYGFGQYKISAVEARLNFVEQDLADTLTENYYLEADIERLERIVSDVFNAEFTKETTVYSKIVTATAYTAREQETNGKPWITANSRPSRVGAIAVSRDLEQLGIRLNDLVVIKDMGLFRVEDRTGEFKRKNTSNPVPVTNTIDVLHAHPKAAKIFGTGPVEIIWLGKDG